MALLISRIAVPGGCRQTGSENRRPTRPGIGRTSAMMSTWTAACCRPAPGEMTAVTCCQCAMAARPCARITGAAARPTGGAVRATSLTLPGSAPDLMLTISDRTGGVWNRASRGRTGETRTSLAGRALRVIGQAGPSGSFGPATATSLSPGRPRGRAAWCGQTADMGRPVLPVRAAERRANEPAGRPYDRPTAGNEPAAPGRERRAAGHDRPTTRGEPTGRQYERPAAGYEPPAAQASAVRPRVRVADRRARAVRSRVRAARPRVPAGGRNLGDSFRPAPVGPGPVSWSSPDAQFGTGSDSEWSAERGTALALKRRTALGSWLRAASRLRSGARRFLPLELRTRASAGLGARPVAGG